jgi:putative nucleotidyltransferase with HDIG domain
MRGKNQVWRTSAARFTRRAADRLTSAARGLLSPGIRLKLAGFLLLLSLFIAVSIVAAVREITERTVRRDLLHRGVAVSRVVSLSAAYSLLLGDRLALYNLAAETEKSSGDIAYVAVQDLSGTVVAHSRIEEQGGPFNPPVGAIQVGTFLETEVQEVSRDGRETIEFSTPILFAGKHVGTAILGLSKESLLAAQRDVRRSILTAAAAFLGLAFAGAFLLASLVTTPVKRLSTGVSELADGAAFHPIPVRSGDELGELTRSFNRMAETILAQKDRLERYAADLGEAYGSLVRVIAASIDARDPYTLGHSNRVARLACDLGWRIGLSEEEIVHLEWACLFHDVGKIRTPDRILLNPYPLTQEEEAVMRRHPADGAEILRMAPSLHRYIPVVMGHHEWYNGRGYPEGKCGAEIHMHAQIIALADAYDAMTSSRPYRKAHSPHEAVEEILRWRGTQFSPELTDVFVRMIEETPSTVPVAIKDMEGLPL